MTEPAGPPPTTSTRSRSITDAYYATGCTFAGPWDLVYTPAVAVRVAEDGWFYVVRDPDGRRHAPEAMRIVAGDGSILTRRRHGYAARLEVIDESGADLPVATLVRAASAVGRALEKHGDSLAC